MLFPAPLTPNLSDAVIRTGIRDTNPQVIATAIWVFLEFPSNEVNTDEFGPELGVHRCMIPAYSQNGLQVPCFIQLAFTEFFEARIPLGLDLRTTFASEYDFAVDLLRQAVRYRSTDPVAFVTAIDAFNQLVAIKISENIDGKQIPKDEYGNILGAMSKTHPIISTHFQECHNLRSSSKGAHAWATSLGNWSQDISHTQKDSLIRNLRAAYQQFVNIVAIQQGIPLT